MPGAGEEDAASAGDLRLSFSAACLPHPDKVKRGGEDAFFACPRTRCFGVADGVGGFAEIGVDPGLFARRLMLLAHEQVRSSPEGAEVDLEDALLKSAARLREEQLQGGTTALLGQLTRTTLSVLNLGDSGAMLLRPALRTRPGSNQPLLFPRVIYRSSDQTHYFNCPYQLAATNTHFESPDYVRIRVRPGDIVVAATDGVFDNLFDHQLQAITAQHLGGVWRKGKAVQPHLQGLAESIASHAQQVGQKESQQDIITPFALAAHSEGLSLRGGKLDDTTVVVGLVCRPGGPDDMMANGVEAPQDGGALPLLHNFEAGEAGGAAMGDL